MFSDLNRGFAAFSRLLLAVALPAVWARAQEIGTSVGPGALPAAPIYSKDGSVTVYAPVSKAAYRAPVLLFVDRTREELQRAVRLKLGSQLCPLEVAIGGKSDGDKRVLTARLRDEAGRSRERIELPDPEAAELGAFRRAIFIAMLRGWMVDAGGKEETLRDLPLWLIDGVLRSANREQRQADSDRTLLLWSRACLPAAPELLSFDSLAASREPAVAAVLAGWFLEKHPEGVPFERLLRAAATGTPWEPKQVSMLLAGTEDPAAFDEALDLWLLSEGRQVIKPGVTTRGIARRFRSHLLLYPSDYDKNMSQGKAGLTMQEAATRLGDPAVRSVAQSRAVAIRMAALGRDGMLLAVSESYAHFLEALARGEKQGELSRMLIESERLRRELERKTARGEVLRRSMEG